MTQIVVDSPLKTQFAAFVEPVEVVDDHGRSLGLFVPAEAMHTPDDCPYSDEELEEMRKQPAGRPLTEIWKSLGAK
jgi:hypothetical protein